MKPLSASVDPASTAEEPQLLKSQGDDGDQLYVPFKAWLEAKAGRSVLLAALALLAVQALVRGYVKFGNWFVGDDLAFIGRASTMRFWSSDYLLAGWNGHFMPGAFALVKVLNSLWPLNYVPVAVVDLVLQAIAGLLAYKLLVELFGRRPAILVPLAICLFSPMTLPAFVWWAAALNQLPGQIAMTAMLLMQVKYHRTGLVRYGVLGAATFAAGLLFSEKVLLTLPCVFALTLLFFTPGPPLPRLRAAVRDHFRIWVAYIVVLVPYLAFYVTHVKSPVDDRRNITLTIDTLGTAIGHAVLPALFGGPWAWSPIGMQGGVADPGRAMVTLTTIFTVVLMWVAVVRNRRAVFGLTVLVAYELVNAVILGVTRAAWVGPVIGAEYRYSTDACVILAIFGALAFLPLAGTFALGKPARLIPRGSRPAQRHLGDKRTLPLWEPALSGGLCLALVASSLISTFGYDRLWRNNTIETYFANAQRDVAAARRPVVIANTGLPESIQSGLFLPWNLTSTLMTNFKPAPQFLTNGRSSRTLVMPDDQGHLRQVNIEGFRNKKGPHKGCGWFVNTEPRAVPLGATTLPWLWYVRVGYLASEDATTTVTAGSISSKVTIHRGLNNLYLMGDGAISEIRFSGLSKGSLCTDDVVVGFAKPVPDSHPEPKG